MTEEPFALNFIDIDSPTIMIDASKTVVYSVDIHKFIAFLVTHEFSGFVFVTQEGYLYAFGDDSFAYVYIGNDMVEWRKEYEQKGVIKSKRG